MPSTSKRKIVRGEPRSRATCFFVTLPVPPSANALNKNVPGRGRVLNKEYSRWTKQAGLLVNAAVGDELPSGPWGVQIVAAVGHNRDIDNLVKPINDLLVTCGIIDDDKFVEEGEYRRARASDRLVPDDRVKVGVYSMLGAWPDFDIDGTRKSPEEYLSGVLSGGGLEGERVSYPARLDRGES